MKISSDLSLLKDSEWSRFDGEPCRVIEFNPMCWIEEGRIYGSKKQPYASIILECKKVSNTIRGYITHKIDFIHLWKVFKERTVKENEEVIIVWTIEHYKPKWIKYFSVFQPKLWVMIFPEGHLEFMADPNWQPEAGKRPSVKEMLIPIVDLKPKIME